jgi:uncharacterized cupredoxin-like copper-binding protein
MSRSRLLRAALLALPLVVGAGGAALAHHSFAMYDNSKYTKLDGTVKTYLWSNPHTMIDFVVAGPDGAMVEWTAECSPTNMLRGKGWTLNSLKPGDKVEIVLHPNRQGDKYGLLVSVARPDGLMLKDKD